ncbi:biotin-dependent carboxyltransferase family protein [Kineococcus glutinatus]|uniref:Biotin-dependent carboxyltransferase family protein n=1 Tax=Kineococcus glutinatus TaxID=1070872 RepID=A0ABP9HMA2_9ACTN
MSGLEVVEPGPASTVQDLGRPGLLRWGVGVSGAADRGSLRLANSLVGNPPGHACVEVVLGGLAVRARQRCVVAVAGAPAPARLDGGPVGHASVLVLHPGQVLRLGTAAAGLRSYLAVRGGVDVEPVLGSRSRDTLAGIGPAPLGAGDVLPVGAPPVGFPRVRTAVVPVPITGELTLGVRPGPRADRFADPAALFAGTWRVSPQSDRVGVRLDRADGPALQRADDVELPPEGVALGSLQVPPSGQPVLFLADHPVTGGYPVVGVVAAADVDRAAQARPGQLVRFRPASRPCPERGGNS